jgi:hypothetical protein
MEKKFWHERWAAPPWSVSDDDVRSLFASDVSIECIGERAGNGSGLR